MGKILGARMGHASRLLRHRERTTAGWVSLLGLLRRCLLDSCCPLGFQERRAAFVLK